MSKLDLNAVIEKLAAANQPGNLNSLVAALAGTDRFTIKEAAYKLGAALYTKRAQYEKIHAGIKAAQQLGIKMSSLGRIMRGAGAGPLQANTRPTAQMGAVTAPMAAVAPPAPRRNAAIMQAVEAPMVASSFQGLGGGSLGRLFRGRG